MIYTATALDTITGKMVTFSTRWKPDALSALGAWKMQSRFTSLSLTSK